jgi:polyhydroxybutyrate depolymerase
MFNFTRYENEGSAMKISGTGKTLRLTLLIAALLVLVCGASVAAQGDNEQDYGGRSLFVYVPSELPAPGKRALVVVLHGGLGNAQRIVSAESEHGLNMDAVAEKAGFIVAYLNGTRVTRHFRADKLGWNAGGGCCGVPAEKQVDDVSYIKGAVDYLVKEYGIDRSRIYGMGHSNGAMMTQRVMCETGMYAAAVAISGPLNLTTENCAAARGRKILAIHGVDDKNVPVAGGQGSRGISRAVYNSEESSRQIFVGAGASYTLQLVKGADHKLDHIDAAIQASEGETIAEKAARFFGLVNSSR